MIRATETEVASSLADTYRAATAATFNAVCQVLIESPPDLTAREAGENLRAQQEELEARLVARFDQALAQMEASS